MKFLKICSVQLVSVMFGFVLISSTAWAEGGKGCESLGDWFLYSVIMMVLVGSLLSIMMIRTALRRTGWSLAIALSEPVMLTAMKIDENGVETFIPNESGVPFKIEVMRASSSRVVAFMGLVVILLMFLGFGAFSLCIFARTGTMPPSIGDAVKFLLSGLTLFAPYMINKFSKVFESFSPGGK